MARDIPELYEAARALAADGKGDENVVVRISGGKFRMNLSLARTDTVLPPTLLFSMTGRSLVGVMSGWPVAAVMATVKYEPEQHYSNLR